jgi:hypothetical protein
MHPISLAANSFIKVDSLRARITISSTAFLEARSSYKGNVWKIRSTNNIVSDADSAQETE